MRTTTPRVPDLDADVFGMDASETLGLLQVEDARERAAAAGKMRAVTHWADLHRVSDGIPGSLDEGVAETLPRFASIEGVERELRLAGQGACFRTSVVLKTADDSAAWQIRRKA
jgi:hypothetical protein